MRAKLRHVRTIDLKKHPIKGVPRRGNALIIRVPRQARNHAMRLLNLKLGLLLHGRNWRTNGSVIRNVNDSARKQMRDRRKRQLGIRAWVNRRAGQVHMSDGLFRRRGTGIGNRHPDEKGSGREVERCDWIIIGFACTGIQWKIGTYPIDIWDISGTNLGQNE